MLDSIREELSYDIELVIAREYLLTPDLAGLAVLDMDDLGVLLQDFRETPGRQDLLPEVIRLDPISIRRVSCPVIPPLVERKKPRRFTVQPSAEPHLGIVDGKMGHTPAE